jgi:Fe-S cluster assembly iron-binding protein IscA
MIRLTERAATGLQELLVANNAPPGQGVRLVPSGTGGIGMTISVPRQGDEVVRRGEEPLLIVDSRIAETLAGVEIDCETSVVDGEPRTEFRTRSPG